MNEDAYDSELLWCIDCLKCHGPDCPQEGPLFLIKDTPTVSKAVASIPSTLELASSSSAEERLVVARQAISRRTVFGPLEAPEREGNDEQDRKEFILKIFKKDGSTVSLDTGDERCCNWMTLVTVATTTTEQNVIVYQYKDALYFTIIKDIQIGEVLRVWYAPNYAAKMGKPLLEEDQSTTIHQSTTIDQLTTLDSPKINKDIVLELFTQVVSQNAQSTTAAAAAAAVDSTAESKTITISQPLLSTKEGSSGSTTSTTGKEGEIVYICYSIQPETASQTSSTTSDDLQKVDGMIKVEDSTMDISGLDSLSLHSYSVVPIQQSRNPDDVKTSSSVEECTGSEDSTTPPKSAAATELLQDGANLRIRRKRIAKSGRPRKSPKYLTLTDKEYKRIMKKVTEKSYRSCWECSCLLESPQQLREHILQQHQVEPLPCQECSKLCISPPHLALHLESNHGDEQTFGCPLCDRRFLHAKFFRSHLKKFHSENYNCATCNCVFWYRRKYLEHIREHQRFGDVTDSTAMYRCEHCSKEFTSQSGLSNHMTIIHDGKTHKCEYCAYSAACITTYQEHILNNHPQNDLGIPSSELMPCDRCNAVFLTSGSLKRHSLNHTKLAFKCNNCDHVYTRKSHLKMHNCIMGRVRNTLDQDTVSDFDRANPFECQQCFKLFSSKANMKLHAKTHTVKQYQCNICNKDFHKRFNFDAHKYCHLRVATDDNGDQELIQVGGTEKKSYACSLCQCQFKTLEKLNKHQKQLHLPPPPVYLCVPCQEIFPTPEDLAFHTTSHIRIALPEDMSIDAMHACQHCCKVFIGPQELAVHMKQHENKFDHICEYCGQTFRRLDCLKQHIRNLHHLRNSSGDSTHCQICRKPFQCASSLRTHMKTHTGQQDYECPHCQRRFIQSGNYNRHVLGHTKEKTIQCETCNRRFKFMENLNRHQLVHKSYDFQCSLCDQRFSTQRFLNNHIRKIHEAAEACSCEYCGVKFTVLTSYRKHMSRKHSQVDKKDYVPNMVNNVKQP